MGIKVRPNCWGKEITLEEGDIIKIDLTYYVIDDILDGNIYLYNRWENDRTIDTDYCEWIEEHLPYNYGNYDEKYADIYRAIDGRDSYI